MAGVEAATSLLHLGLTHDALRFAQSMRKLAYNRNSEHYEHAALIVETMATFQRAGRKREQRWPGLRAVHALETKLKDFPPSIGVLHCHSSGRGRVSTPTQIKQLALCVRLEERLSASTMRMELILDSSPSSEWPKRLRGSTVKNLLSAPPYGFPSSILVTAS